MISFKERESAVKRMIVTFNFESRLCSCRSYTSRDEAMRAYQTAFEESYRKNKYFPRFGSYIDAPKDRSEYILYRNNRISQTVHLVNPRKLKMANGITHTVEDCIVALIFMRLCYAPEQHPFQQMRDSFDLQRLCQEYGTTYIDRAIWHALSCCHYKQVKAA